MSCGIIDHKHYCMKLLNICISNLWTVGSNFFPFISGSCHSAYVIHKSFSHVADTCPLPYMCLGGECACTIFQLNTTSTCSILMLYIKNLI